MSKMNLWRREHGDGFAIPEAELIAAGLMDSSWHNDTCPCFHFPEDEDGKLQLWIDHPEDSEREQQGGKRYSVQFSPDGRGSMPSDECYTDHLATALAKMSEWRAKL